MISTPHELYVFRASLGINQLTLATVLGMTQSTVSSMERGTSELDLTTRWALAGLDTALREGKLAFTARATFQKGMKSRASTTPTTPRPEFSELDIEGLIAAIRERNRDALKYLGTHPGVVGRSPGRVGKRKVRQPGGVAGSTGPRTASWERRAASAEGQLAPGQGGKEERQ